MVSAKSMVIKQDEWYRVKVDYNFDKIKVYIQSGNVRENKLLFNKELKGVTRGTIGFATKGN